MKKDKDVILHLLISGIKEGKSPAQISKKNNIKKTTLQYHLRQLQKLGVAQKVAYGTWEIKKKYEFSPKATSTKKQIRGHAFNWKVRFRNKINWKDRLKKEGIKYQLIGVRGSTARIIFNGKKIWLTNNGLIIYEPNSFFAKSSYSAKGMAVYELDRTIKALGRKLKINLTPYEFTTSREHYGQIKNELAKQYNDKGEKLFIRDDKGIWMWIDDSHSLNELETNDPKNSRGVQNWYNDMKKTNFEVTPTFLVENINKVTENQLMFNKNFESHVEAIQTLSGAVKELKEEIRRLKYEKN